MAMDTGYHFITESCWCKVTLEKVNHIILSTTRFCRFKQLLLETPDTHQSNN